MSVETAAATFSYAPRTAGSIAGHLAERRPRAGEEWLAATQHDGVEVEAIFINKTKIGQASRQIRSSGTKRMIFISG